MDALRQKTRLLERSQIDKFEAEKDKIVQVLEASFAQRSQLAIQENEESLLAKFTQEKKARWAMFEFAAKIILKFPA